MGFPWISSFLATRGRYALVTLGRAVGRTGNVLSQVAEPSCGVAMFQPKSSLVQAFVFQRQLHD